MNYNKIKQLEYETNCTQINQRKWDELMNNAKKANKKKINSWN